MNEYSARGVAPRSENDGPMNTWIALIRGINVGGKNTLPMKELVAVLESLGARTVRTYIQSGNAAFVHTASAGSRLSGQIRAEIGTRCGLDPSILLLRLEEIEQAMGLNPFPEAERSPATLHAGFLEAAPRKPDLKRLEGLRSGHERFDLIDRVFYLHAPAGIGRSKLAAGAERCLGVPMTVRNWRTVTAIRTLAREL
jgi:uncharacterized protein (DUF1697 family)